MKSDTSINDGTRDGNTRSSRAPLGKYWCFTLNNWTKEELDHIINKCKKCDTKYVIGEEVGDSGTPHLQGFIEAPNRIRPKEKFGNDRIHWERCKGDKNSNIKYCSKDGKFHTNMCLNIYKDPLENNEMFDWQKRIIDVIKSKPDDRTIHWFWDEHGNRGKTTLCKHICTNYHAIVVSGAAADIKYGVSKYIEEHGGINIVIFHFVRSQEDRVSYEAIEAIKDGMFFNTKYESNMCIFNSPHVICFANFKPNMEKLSSDRWSVEEI